MGKKKKFLFSLLMAAIMMIAMSATVFAAQKNPLAKMPTNIRTVVGQMGGQMQFTTPQYPEKTKIEISAVSSNKNVMDVFAETENYMGRFPCAFYNVQAKKAGTARLTVTVKLNGKTYKKTCKYTFDKYVSPFTSFKIADKNLTSELKKETNLWNATGGDSINGKLIYKLKPGYKVISATCRYSGSSSFWHKVKNGQKLSKGSNLIMVVKNTKTNTVFTIHIN